MAVKGRPTARDFKYGRISGRFAVGATGAVGTKTGDESGARWSVVRDSAGTYTVTIKRTPKKIIAADAVVRKTTGADLYHQLKTIDETNGKVTFRFQTAAATATDPASGDDVAFWIDFEP